MAQGHHHHDDARRPHAKRDGVSNALSPAGRIDAQEGQQAIANAGDNRRDNKPRQQRARACGDHGLVGSISRP